MKSPRLTLPSGRNRRYSLIVLLGWLLFVCSALTSVFIPNTLSAAPQIILPTPPGEAWRIIQGYGCGTHNAWDRYSLDLVQVDGPTYGAPVRAAAGGEVWHWESRSGTLILNHGGFFTMYTHMQGAVDTTRGRIFEVGETLGYAGDRGSPGVPHLHFTLYTANRDGWSGKQSLPLSFAEGYELPEIGGCNQHGGTVMTAMSLQPPQINFSGPQPAQWYRGDERIVFDITWGGGGMSQRWNEEPAGDAPMFPAVIDGYAPLRDAGDGMHTLYVRAWGPDGKQTLTTYGPIGFDSTAPSAPLPINEMIVGPGSQAVLNWQPSSDAHSGIAGYRIYVGADVNGKSDWFSAEPFVKTPPLEAGRYLVRLQALDQTGNSSDWVTVGTIVVE